MALRINEVTGDLVVGKAGARVDEPVAAVAIASARY